MLMMVSNSELRSTTSVDNNDETADGSQFIGRGSREPAAFVRLYRRHYDAVFRYCVHRLFERATAEDVTSEVFLKVVENIQRFRGDEPQFRNWLYKIATNAVNNHLRKSARRNRLLESAREQTNNGAADCGESPERLALLKEAVLSLKPRYQTIITLRFFEKLKLTEIAEVLGSRPGTVRSQMARALDKLRIRITSAQQEV